MHILLIHQAFTSPGEAGGTRHFEFARYMVKRGHKFTVVASNLAYITGKCTVRENGLIKKQNIDGINILRAYTYPSLHRSYLWRIISFLSFMITSVIAGLKDKNVDLVIGTTPPIFQAGSAWLIAILHRCPFLLEIRDLWPEFAIDIGILTNPILIKLSRWFESFIYNRAIVLLVNSPAYRDYLIGKGVPAGKIKLISNGVDIGMFDPYADGKQIREKFGLNGKFVVTYAGALGAANDIDTILRAANHLKNEVNIHFLFVGDGKERPRLERLSRELKLLNTTFAGFYPKNMMKDVLAASNTCIATLKNIPMFQTTYPNKVFDYMAAGRPVILGIDGVIRKVVENARAGIFVSPGNDHALSKAILELYSNPEQSQSMGLSGRVYVEEHFDRKKQSKEFEQLVFGLVNKAYS